MFDIPVFCVISMGGLVLKNMCFYEKQEDFCWLFPSAREFVPAVLKLQDLLLLHPRDTYMEKMC